MQFLAPLFLAAAAAIALPIALHLIQREQRQAVPFPSLMFLSRIPHRSTRRRRLRDLPLLLLRVLALVLLAAAFARPLLQRARPAAAAGAGAREVVLLIDRSYSMGYGTRWQEARAAALREIDRLGSNDRMSVVAFDARAAALGPPSGDRVALRALVERLRPGWGGTRFDPALRLAADRLNASALPRREVVLISDLQRAGAADGLEARLPAGAELRVVPLAPARAPDLAVADVSFKRSDFGGQERVTASARVVNPGSAPVAGARVTLQLDGRTLHTTSVTLAPHAAATVELPPFTLTGPMRGTVAVGPDALPADDAYRFALAPGQAVRVLVVDGRPGASLFLARALGVGGEPGFAVSVHTGTLSAGDLRDRDVVVLDDAPAPSGEALRQLRAFLQRGGGLVVALGPSSGLSREFETLLPGAAGPVRDRVSGGGAALGAVDLAHPVFDVFRAPHSGDLAAPRFYRYRALDVPAGKEDSSVAVVARFDDRSVALAERRVGRGLVLAWGSTLDREWSDLPVQPVFVPFVQQLVKRAAGFEQARAAHVVGEVADARALARVGDELPLVAVDPEGSRSAIAPGARALPLEQAGFYALRREGRAGAVLATVAANVDVRESDLTPMPAAELAAAVKTLGSAPRAGAQTATSPDERERRQALWWYLLAVVAALLVVETVLSNRRARARTRPATLATEANAG